VFIITTTQSRVTIHGVLGVDYRHQDWDCPRATCKGSVTI